MTHEQRVTFYNGTLRLEGMLAIPAAASQAVVICHPHPQYGGEMDNNVVRGTAVALQHAGIATLRFNFRGVGHSDGHYSGGSGEVDDARAAVGFLSDRTGLTCVTLAGYSFGAMVALRAGHDHAGVDRLIAIAPPVSMFELTFLNACTKPKLFLVGDHDQFCPSDALERAVAAFPGDTVVKRLRGADHFLFGSEACAGDEVVRFLCK